MMSIFIGFGVTPVPVSVAYPTVEGSLTDKTICPVAVILSGPLEFLAKYSS